MTTILADTRLGIMLSDSYATDGDRAWANVRKVWRHKGVLLGFAGDCDEAEAFKAWWKAGCPDKRPKFAHSSALAMSAAGLLHFCNSIIPLPVKGGIEAIGTGAKVAMAVHEALDYQDPKRAVALACKHSDGSRAPVRIYQL